MMASPEYVGMEAQSDENFRLSMDLQRSKELCGQLEAQIRRLLANSFIAKGGAFGEEGHIAAEIEALIRQKDEEQRLRLEQARLQGDVAPSDETLRLSMELQRSEELRVQLRQKLRHLLSNTWAVRGREESRLALEMEALAKQKDEERQIQLEQARVQADAERAQISQQAQELTNECERLRHQVEAQAAEMRMQQDVRSIIEQIPTEFRESLESTLAVARSEQSLGLPALPFGEPYQLATQAGTAEAVEKLRQEKKALYDEIQKLQVELAQSAHKAAAVKERHAKELQDAKSQLDKLAAQREKLNRAAMKSSKNIKVLQQKIVKQDLALQQRSTGTSLWVHYEEGEGGREAGSDGEASEAGLSEVSELDGLENALDVFVADGQLHQQLVKRLEASAALPPDSVSADFVRTIVCLELVGFDAGYSSVTTGLRPSYASQVSFGPFLVGDSLLRLFLEGSLSVELRGSLPTDSTHHILAKGSIPLARILRPKADDQRFNPPFATTLTLFDPGDREVAAAKLRMKLRLRYPMADLIEDYHRRQGVQAMDLKWGPSSLTVATLGAVSGRRMLAVRVHRVFGLRSTRAHYAVAPYVFYQLPHQAPYFTRSGRGSDCVLDDLCVVSVQVDSEFCQWASGTGLHFIVFDDLDLVAGTAGTGAAGGQARSEAPDPTSALGFLGEVQVPLRSLLHDSKAKVDGTFALKKSVEDPAHAAIGYIEVTMWWEDTVLSSALDALSDLAPPMAENEFRGVSARLARGLRAQREVSDIDAALTKLAVPPAGLVRKRDFAQFVAMGHPLQLGLSLDEANRWFDRLAARTQGTLTLTTLLSELKKLQEVDMKTRWAWLEECMTLVRESVYQKKEITLDAAYKQLVGESRDGGRGAGLDRSGFAALIRAFREDLTDLHLDNVWFMLDKEPSGHLHFPKFKIVLSGRDPYEVGKSGKRPGGTLSSDHILIVLGRLLRKFRAASFESLDQIVEHCDRNKDGKLSVGEFETLLRMEVPSLSQFERRQILLHLDKNQDGVISLLELRSSLEEAERRQKEVTTGAEESLKAVREAVVRASKGNVPRLFTSFCRTPSVWTRADFDRFTNTLAPEVAPDNIALLWHLADKNVDGALELDEFKKHFAPA